MLAPGQAVAQYVVEDVAGSGGMGVVYRARDTRLGRRVGLKVIAPHLAREPIMRRRLNRESAVLAGLDHPNVLPLFEAGEADGVLFLASRWVQGRDLGRLVAEDGALGVEAAARVVGQVAAALAAAHRSGLIHRDVKPSNVLVAEDGHVYLGDFGLARHSGDAAGLTATEQLLGTLDYVSPEQIRGEDIDARSDVYALGGLLAFALTGEVPYPRDGHAAKLYAHLSADPPAPSRVRDDVPSVVDDIVARAMAKDRRDRYPTAARMQADLQALATGRLAAVTAPAVTGATAAPAPVAASAPAPVEAGEPPAPPAPPAQDAPAPAPPADDDVAVPVARLSTQAARRASAARPAAGPPTPQHLSPLDARDLAPPPPPAAEAAAGPEAPPRRRRRAVLALAAAGVALLALVPAVLLLGLVRDEEAGTQTVAVARSAGAVAIAGGHVWVSSPDSGVIVGVPTGDIEGPKRRIDIGDPVTGMSARGDRLYVTAGRQLLTLPTADPASGRRQRVPVVASYVAPGARTTWMASYNNSALLRVRDGAVVRTRLSSPTSDLALGLGALWIAHAGEGTVGSIDLESGAPRRLDRVRGRPEALAVTQDAVWVADIEGDALVRLDPRSGRADAPIRVGGDPAALAADEREVWVARRGEDAVTRIDARTGRPLDEIGTAREPVGLAMTRRDVWVVGRRGELTRIPRGSGD